MPRPPAPTAPPALASLAPRVTRLVQTAPALAPEDVEELAAALLGVALAEARARPALARLACALEEVVDELAAGRVDAGIALPAVAMACATLVDAARAPGLGAAVEAARFEVETLLPRPDAPARGGPDVPLAALTRALPSPPPLAARRAARLAGAAADDLARAAVAPWRGPR